MILNPRRGAILGCVACLAASAALAAAILGVGRPNEARADAPAKADPALERTREQVKMLDDLYKNAVVSITKTYVAEQEDRPAIMIAKDIFAAMQDKGWHSARLVDATGDPVNDLNAPRTEFEKEAYRQIRSGQPYYDRVVGEGRDRRLLAATVVPVVMPKCAECHGDRKVGEVLGFLRYEVPIK